MGLGARDGQAEDLVRGRSGTPRRAEPPAQLVARPAPCFGAIEPRLLLVVGEGTERGVMLERQVRAPAGDLEPAGGDGGGGEGLGVEPRRPGGRPLWPA